MLRPHRLLIALTTALVLGAGAGIAEAAPGDLDTTYGGGTGASRPEFDGLQNARGVAIQPDGKIVVAGVATAGPSANVFTARFDNPAGTLDGGYGDNGARSEPFGLPTAASAMALTGDGKVLVGGIATQPDQTGDLFVARLVNGSADLSFGGGSGAGLADFGGDEEGDAMAVAPDGKIVVAGSAFGKDADAVVVARFTAAGDNDASFGTAGTDGAAPDFGASADAHAVALQGDGKIVLAGGITAGTKEHFLVARLDDPSGTPDAGFSGGHVSVDFGGTLESANALLVQPDGKIVVAGTTDAGGTDDFAIARLGTDGKLDPTFGDGGKATLDFGASDDQATALALEQNGKIVVVGQRKKGQGANFADIAVARLQPNGTKGPSFGSGGQTLVDLGRNEFGTAVALQGDGKIVVAGNSINPTNQGVVVARLLGDPIVGGGTGPSTAAPGTKVPKCLGRKATIIGTTGRDRLKGTRKADVIVGLAGKDTIRGGGGKDGICAGGGNDTADGRAGADRIAGQGGKDKLLGGSGNDSISAGSGNDRASGGAGKDKILGGAGKDVLSGGAGNDAIRGQSGRDTLKGGPGRDRLSGGAGKDKLRGGPGKDRQKQ